MKQKQLGIIYIIASAFFFALMSFFVRLAGSGVPTIQKSFFRNLIAFFIAAAILIKEREPLKIGKGNMKYMLVRSIAGTLGILCNFYAVDHINLSDASILNKLSPFFAVIFSIFLLKEKVKPAEVAALVVAFAGALLVIKPSFSADFIYGASGMLSGISAGLAYACVRKLGTNGVRGPIIVAFFSGFSCLVTLPYILFNYVPMTRWELFCLLMAGFAAAGGQIFITAAYTKAPAKEISVFDYSQIIFTALLGFFFLNQTPDALSLVGYAVIIGAAIFKWRYAMKSCAVENK